MRCVLLKWLFRIEIFANIWVFKCFFLKKYLSLEVAVIFFPISVIISIRGVVCFVIFMEKAAEGFEGNGSAAVVQKQRLQ